MLWLCTEYRTVKLLRFFKLTFFMRSNTLPYRLFNRQFHGKVSIS
jgi:hypothetical protein